VIGGLEPADSGTRRLGHLLTAEATTDHLPVPPLAAPSPDQDDWPNLWKPVWCPSGGPVERGTRRPRSGAVTLGKATLPVTQSSEARLDVDEPEPEGGPSPTEEGVDNPVPGEASITSVGDGQSSDEESTPKKNSRRMVIGAIVRLASHGIAPSPTPVFPIVTIVGKWGSDLVNGRVDTPTAAELKSGTGPIRFRGTVGEFKVAGSVNQPTRNGIKQSVATFTVTK
jgi:hypothetical protein